MKKRVILIPHVHWDREWFHTEPNFSLLLNKHIDDLEKFNHKYNFDGHTWAIDDYIKVNELPKNVKNNIKTGQIMVGPLYVQSDFYNSSYGTLETNLRIGKSITKKIGKIPNVLYIADSFGFHEQMPQIFNKHGFHKFVCWRGIKSEDKKISNLFHWKGIDRKSSLLTSVMAPSGGSINDNYFSTGYSLTYPYNVKKEDEKQQLILLQKLYHNYLAQKEVWADLNIYWIPVGFDWAPVPLSLPKFINWLNEHDEKYIFEIGTYDDYFNFVQSKKPIPTLSYSNLNYSGTSKIHRTIASNRYDIKKEFREAEAKLYYKLEQIELMYKEMGGKLMTKEFKDAKIYKKLLASSAHDSLGGCNNDETNFQALARIKKVHDTIKVYCDYMLRNIKDNLGLNLNDYLIINAAPFKQNLLFKDTLSSSDKNEFSFKDDKTNIVTTSIEDLSHNWDDSPKTFNINVLVSAKNMEPFSYRVVRINNKIKYSKSSFVKFKNDHIILQLNDKNFQFKIRIEEDFGDEFDFSTNKLAKFSYLKNFEIIKEIKSDHLIYNEFKAFGKFCNKEIEYIFSVYKNGEKLFMDINTVNTLQNARISLEFNENKATLSRSLAFIKQELDDIPNFKEIGYKDSPVNNFTNDGLVRLNNKEANIYTRGTNEVEFKDGKVRLILARFPSYIGKSNLDYRPGVASGPRHLLRTKDAKLNKSLVFNFCIDFGNPIKGLNEWNFYGIGKQGEQINKLNNKLDYLHIITPKLKVKEKMTMKHIDHTSELIGLYRLNEDHNLSFVVSNPLNMKANTFGPFEIKYENIL